MCYNLGMIDFTETQKKTIASGLTVLALAVVVVFVTLVGWLVLRVLTFVAPAITPVVFGLFLAMFFRPYYGFLVRRLRHPALSVTVVMLSVLIPLALLLWNFGSFVVTQIFEFIGNAPERTERFVAWFNATFPNAVSQADRLGIPYREWMSNLKSGALETAGNLLGYMSSLLNWLVSLIFFVYFLTRPTVTGSDCVNGLGFLKADTKVFVAEQIDAFLQIVVGFFQRQVVICVMEGLMYGTGFWLVGLEYGFLLGFLLSLLNLVPLFGTVVCLPMALPLAYWGNGGSSLCLVGVLCVWLTGQVLDGYLITPKIQGDKTGLGYAGVICSFFVWGVVFQSLLGLLLAIPLSAFCLVFWRALKSRYIKPVI